MQISNGASSKKKTSYDKSHTTKSLFFQKGHQVGKTHGATGGGILKKMAHSLGLDKPIPKGNQFGLDYVMSKSNPKSKGKSAPTAYDKMKSIENASKLSVSNKSPKKTHVSKPKTPTSNPSVQHKTNSPTVSNTSKTVTKKTTTSSGSSKVVSSKASNTSSSKKLTSLQKLKNELKASSDAYFTSQDGALKKQRDSSIRQINDNYTTALGDANKGIQTTNDNFTNNQNTINKQAYTDNQQSQLFAYNNGIQNSQQMLGLQAGDNARANDAINTATTERDKAIADLQSRIAQLGKDKNSDLLDANNTYTYNSTMARADATKQYNDNAFTLDHEAYNQAQQQAQALAQAKAYAKPTVVQPTQKSISQGVSPIAKAYSTYQNAKNNTSLDTYYQKEKNIFQPIPYKNPIMPIPSPGNNQQLSSWEKYRMITKGL